MIIVITDRKEYISGSYNNKNFSIPYSEEMLNKMKSLEIDARGAETVESMRQIISDFEGLVSSFDFKKDLISKVGGLTYVPATNKYHIIINSGYSDIFIPTKLIDIILDNFERGIDNAPIIDLCRRFMLNLKPTQDRFNMLANYVTQKYVDKEEVEKLMAEKGVTEEVAIKHATYPDLQISYEGYLKTSKVVNEITKKWSLKLLDGKPVLDEEGNPIKELVDRYQKSFYIDEETGEVTEEVRYPDFLEDRKFTPAIYTNGDDFYSGDVLGYKYEVGQLAMLDSWDKVSTADGMAHEKGLHTGGLSYIDGYLHGNRVVLDVFVCPSQIGKFTREGLGEMTCKEFFIYGASYLQGSTKGLYHTSTYAKIQASTITEMLNLKAEEIKAAKDSDVRDVYDMQAISDALNSQD